MLLETQRDHAYRVLGIFPHPRGVGHVVLDECGLVPSGAFACRTDRYSRLDARLASLERLIQRSVGRFRPSVIVIVQARGSASLEAMIAHAISAAERTRLPLRIRHETGLADLFVDDSADEYDQLGQSITRVFFPELAQRVQSWGRGGEAARRRPRSAWKAAAGALAVLAETQPQAVLALARPQLPPQSGAHGQISRSPHPRPARRATAHAIRRARSSPRSSWGGGRHVSSCQVVE